MKVVRPIAVDSGNLVSSTLAEPSGSDPSAWSSGTTYAEGDTARLASTHRVYQSLQASNLNHSPDVSPTWWADAGGVNKWAMFDDSPSTQSIDGTTLTVVFDPGVCDALVLIGCEGNTADVTMTDGPGGPTVYDTTLELQVPKVVDWYGYFFEPFRYVPIFVLTDLPPYVDGRITVTITADVAAACAMCIPGRSLTIGGTRYGVQAGIRDYSRKAVDEATGLVTLTQGRFAKTMTAQVRADAAYASEITDILESLRATPCVWVGDDTGELSPLAVFGWYKDFRFVLDLPTAGVYSLEIEGMT